MGVLGDERNTAQATADDIKGAINMGKNAARTAKTVSKAAGEMASGNMVGAAVTIAKDPETVKKILFFILAPIIFFAFLLISFMYALPTAIFETVASFFEDIADKWDEIYASNDYGGGTLSTLLGCTIKVTETIFEGFGDALKNTAIGIWDTIRFAFGQDSEKNQTELITENAAELTIVTQEASQKMAIVKKAIAVNKKYQIRAEQIKKAIDGKSRDIYNSNGISIDSFIRSKVATFDNYVWEKTKLNVEIIPMGTANDTVVNELEEALQSMQNVQTISALNEAKDRFSDIITNKFPTEIANGKSSNNYALSLLSLMTAQQGGTLQGMKMADFMRYLGYYKSDDPKNTVMNIGYCNNPFTAKVQSWRGTFKPQYLMEELKSYQSERNYLQMQVDMCPHDNNTSKLARIAELDSIIADYENSGMAVIDLLIVIDCIDLDNLGEPIKTCKNGYYYDLYKSRDGDSTLEIKRRCHIDNDTGEITWNIQPTLKIYIVPRNIDSLTSVVGLWNGPLTNAQTGDIGSDEDSAA